MVTIRKTSYYIITGILIIALLMTGLNQIFADDIYPLEAGEKLIEKTVIDQNHTEIFTQVNEGFYLKKLQRYEGKWIIESAEAIYPKWTGLETNEINRKGDRKLAAALDNELNSYGLETASLPPVVDYSHSRFLPPAGDQMNENSCVGWATGYYLRSYQQAKDIGWEVKESGIGIDSHMFSPSFIYNQINNGVDKGASIEIASELLMDVGVATLEDFPYIAGDFRTQPNPAIIQSANPHRVLEWLLLYSDMDSNQYILEETKKYLNTGNLVVAGNLISLKFMYPSIDQAGNSIITREYDPRFKHAFVVVGYDDNFISSDGFGAFKIVSSWGPDWGNNGFSYISYEAFTANALEGFVYTDLVNREPQELAVDINNNVIFNMNFSGTGKFDIKIKNITNQLIYEENSLQGDQGENSLVWNGRDTVGNSVDDGVYRLNIIPYRGDTPKPAFITTFNKLGRVESASAWAYSYDNAVQYVDIPIIFKADGMLSIKVDYTGTVYELISNQAVGAGESNTYTIFKRDFDFNNIDLNQVRIIIEIS